MELDRLRANPLRTWLAIGASSILALLIAVMLFPQRVYDDFIWRYFWGPVVADAHGVSTSGCAVRNSDGSVDIYNSAADCAVASGVVANPGYTPTSTITYALVLIFALVGVVLLMDRLNIGTDRGFFYSLIPFVFFGGALRVVEDVNAVLFREGGEMIISLPWVGFLISPLIYFLVFFLAAITVLGSRWMAIRGLVSRYEYPVVMIGSLCLGLTLVGLGYLTVTEESMSIYWIVPLITLGGATLITILVWYLTETYWPVVNAGTGLMGAVIIWGHTVDGVANVLSLDWAQTIGLPQSYGPKHVINRLIIDVTSAVQPAAVTDVIGTAWPFLPLKVIVAVVVVWVFNEEVFEDSRAFSMMLLVAILAVGLGPGTRDFLRATIGI